MKHIGLLGATFDPVHQGHLLPALAVAKQLQLDAVWFIPNKAPPYKDTPQASDAQRIAMIELTIEDQPDLYLCDTEIKKKSFCYTADSLAELKHQNPEYKFYFLMGQDSLHHLHLWHKWRTLITHAHLVIYARPDADQTHMDPEVQSWFDQHHCVLEDLGLKQPLKDHGSIFSIEVPQINISSSAIRKKLKEKQELEPDLIATKVLRYIQKHHIYQ